MPRPKGSKNKPKTVKATVDFAAQIAEKQSAKEAAALLKLHLSLRTLML